MASEQAYGVTPPISVQLPTEAELRQSDALLEELKRQKTFESPAETAKREEVLASIQTICDAFVRRVAQEKEPKNEVLIRNARGKVFTYGSYRLGVYGPGSDIDTLIVAPKYVTREDYFKFFPDLLLSMAPKDAITDMAVVTDAFVPIIKFEYSGISIDLIFSRVIQKQLSPDFKDLKDSGLLRGLDEAELRSLNGTRVTDEILTLVPEQSTFKNALRAIKLWAQRRAVYANIMGFPGGVAWAMLVARVCQLYPKATFSVIVNKFFLVISQWRWPQPVLLKPIEGGPLPVRIWNPKLYKGDTYHLMPVITPAYPSMCATFNITRSSMSIINRELKRALQISESIMVGKRPWSDLFVKHTFFTAGYKYYISVTSAAKTKEAHTIWSGYVESKVRMLVQKLEQHQSIALAHAFNKGYERQHRCHNQEEIEAVQEGSLDYLCKEDTEHTTAVKIEPAVAELPIKAENGENGQPVKPENGQGNEQVKTENGENDHVFKPEPTEDTGPITVVPVKPEASNESKPTDTATASSPSDIYTTTHYIGLELASGAKSLDLSYQVDEFKELCTSWQKYKDDLKDYVSIGVQHVRNFNLPDDVFDDGEKKPQKKAAAKGSANGKKRGPPEENPPPAKRQQASIAAAG
ncbi:putative PAP1-poly(A) polymerase [Fusarium proliferatum ET1]|uniref:Poly(A) polymerase n=2 Tax=Gibberella intermedia TaxID=948311 RepID=A0A1L7VL62_FUSPR|nr:putative PAP1-poly(A) polymerase [Fusarium proliferatum ET1]RBA13103.1 poly(A) polymerase [Fusarium proliferatum]CZR41288.1 probable PAP1-poly(A) polymerase [Fusarium proliferatum ET1]